MVVHLSDCWFQLQLCIKGTEKFINLFLNCLFFKVKTKKLCTRFMHIVLLHRIKFLIFNFTFPKYIFRWNICFTAFSFFKVRNFIFFWIIFSHVSILIQKENLYYVCFKMRNLKNEKSPKSLEFETLCIMYKSLFKRQPTMACGSNPACCLLCMTCELGIVFIILDVFLKDFYDTWKLTWIFSVHK